MGLDISRMAEDISSDDPEIQQLALTTIVRLTPESIEDAAHLDRFLEFLPAAEASDDPDIIFLARKARSFIGELREALAHRSRAGGAPSPREGSDDPADVLGAPQIKLPAAAPAVAVDGQGPSRDGLLEELVAATDSVRLATVVAQLAEVGQQEDLELLVPHLQSEDDRIRANAVEAVGRLGAPDQVNALLLPLMRDGNNRVRANAIKVVGQINFPNVHESLRQMLDSPHIRMRESAIYALCELKPSKDVLQCLAGALKDDYDGVRLRAIIGLVKFNCWPAITVIRPLLEDVNPNIRTAAQRAVNYLGKLAQVAQQKREQG